MYGRQMNLGWSNFILSLFFFLPYFYLDNVRNRIERVATQLLQYIYR